MKNKISASALAAMVALTTGQPGELCEKFINELLSLISDALEAGENVRIKGFGTFKLMEIDSRKSVDVATGEEIEIPAHRRVIFVPCKELASMVNAPFEAFEAEEVADDLPTDVLMLDPEDDELDTIDEDDNSEEEVTTQVESKEGQSRLPDEEQEGHDTIVFGRESMLNAKSVAQAEQSSRHDSRVIRFGENNGQRGQTNFSTQDTGDVQSEPIDRGFTPEAESGEEPSEKSESSRLEEQVDVGVPLHTDNDPSALVELSEEEEGVNYAQASSEETQRRGRFGKGFLLGFITAAVVLALIFLLGVRYGYISPEKIQTHIAKGNRPEIIDNTANAGSVHTVLADSVAEDKEEDISAQPVDTTDTSGVPTRPSDEPKSAQAAETNPQQDTQPKYDTVSTTRYLTTMAQEHYGNYNLWPIIYKENQAILGHPDRIKPGTRVVVPPLSKYKIDPENPDDIAAMKREGVAIYAKFKKK